MAWETRKGTKRQYYTRSRRVNGQVQREYLGCGELARLSAEIDTSARESQVNLRRIAAQQRLREQEQREAIYAAILAPLDALDVLCRAAMRRELNAAGYHQHRWGEWRKQRGGISKGAVTNSSAHHQARSDENSMDDNRAASAAGTCLHGR
jgi:hypothetical protein